METKVVSPMKITKTALFDIINYCGAKPAESGGMLFGYDHDHVIRKFIPDVTAKTGTTHYSIDTEVMNPKIEHEWKKNQLELKGIIHSHKPGLPRPSRPDKDYFNDLKQYAPRKYWYAPILYTIPDGGLDIFPFVFLQDSEEPVPTTLQVVEDDYYEKIGDPKPRKPEPEKATPEKASTVESRIILFQPLVHTIHTSQRNLVVEISLILLAAAGIFSVVFFGSLYGVPHLLDLISKILHQ